MIVKRWIVEGIETLDTLLDYLPYYDHEDHHWHRGLGCYLQLAARSDALDARWGTGVWQQVTRDDDPMWGHDE